jgi:asparagine synthase (glutamine-hydrolysing)
VRKLPPATILEWCAGKFRQYCYWQVPAPARAPRLSFRDATAEAERRLREAVAIRLEADVPVAVLLSGGIDSSLICWATAELGADLTAYTVGVPGERGDESEGAALTARRLGIRHHILALAQADMPEIDELSSAYDEPFATSSALGMLRISHAIGRSAKVVLTGDGGDDLFLGYPRHRYLWSAEKLAGLLPPALARNWKNWRRDGLRSGPLRRAAALMDYATGGIGAYLGKAGGLERYRDKGLLGARFTDGQGQCQEYPGRANGMLETLIDFERRTRFVAEYLKKVDAATMHHGIEARSPFLDQELWNFGAALPVDMRLRCGELKAILRALARRRLGFGIAARRKHGFRIPAERWLASRWLARAEQALSDSILAREGWIDGRNALAELRRSAARGAAAEELWNIFVLESWLQHDRQQRLDQISLGRKQAAATPAPQAVPC